MRLVRAFWVVAALLIAPVSALAQAAPPPVTASDRVLGRADAPVTVIEYASFTCSHCGDWHQNVYPAFRARFVDTGQVRLVFRDFPTSPAQLAAQAAGIARCAAPERFHEVADALFDGQPALFESGQPGPWLTGAVAVSGKSMEQIQTCLADPATLNTLRAGVEAARAAGVQGTPTFFVNGRMVSDTSLEGLTAAIRPLVAER